MPTTPDNPGPLLIVCALGIERLALRHATGGTTRVVRTGMGSQAAQRAVRGGLRTESAPGETAVLATGFCTGLLPGMRPGDLVVAERTRGGRGMSGCVGVPWLARAYAASAARRGWPERAVHTGELVEVDRVVHGSGRMALGVGGAVAADMESATVLRTALDGASHRPVAAVRVVVDAPGHELVRFGTLRGGTLAFRILRSLMPVFHEWHRNLLLSGR